METGPHGSCPLEDRAGMKYAIPQDRLRYLISVPE